MTSGAVGDLRAASIAASLTTRAFGRSLDVRAATESTNDDARAAADAGCPHGHVVVADHQRAGRGSGGRAWDSPAGVDLYFSIVARLALPADRLPPVTLAVGLGVARALDALLGSEGPRAMVKWPNDVLLEGRKCAGVLVETVSEGARVPAAILGVGVGVNRTRFAPPLDASATTLRLASGRPHPRGPTLAAILNAIETEVDRFERVGAGAIAADVDARLAWRGQPVRVGPLEGALLGVDEGGGLRVQTDAGPRVAVSGRLEPR